MLGRSKANTHAELMRSELNDSLDHLMQAATHGAAAVGATTGPRWESTKSAVAPRVDQARSLANSGWGTTKAAVSPLVEAALSGAAEANKQAQKKAKKTTKKMQRKVDDKLHKKDTSNRKTMMVGLVVVGVAAGAGAAYVARRRSRAKWDEYDAGFDAPGALDSAGDTAAGTAEKISDTAAGFKESAADKAARMADKAHNAADKAAGKVKGAADQAAETTGELTDRAASAAKNGRN